MYICTYIYISIHTFRWYTYKYANAHMYYDIFESLFPSQQADLLHFAGSFGAFWGWLGYRMDLFRNYEKMDQAHWWLKLATREKTMERNFVIGFSKNQRWTFLRSILNTCRGCTLPETNSLHLKADAIPKKETIVFQPSIFRSIFWWQPEIPRPTTWHVYETLYSHGIVTISTGDLGASRFNVPCWWCTVRRMTSSHWEMVWRSMKHVRILWNLYG